MLLQEIPGPPDTVEGRDQATTPTRGRCPTSPYFPKKGGGRRLFLPRCYCPGPVRAVPVTGISSSSGGDISVQARAGAGGAGQFPGKARYCDPLPPSQTTHTAFLQRAEAITNVS